MEIAQTPVTQHLDELSVPYRTFRHQGPVTSLAQAARERGQAPEQVVRSLLFRLAEGEYAMVLVAGPQQIHWRALRRTLDQSRLTTASRDELKQVTGYEIGAVAPFGLPRPLPILVDESVLAQDEISLGSGVRGTAVLLKTTDLLQALKAAELPVTVAAVT